MSTMTVSIAGTSYPVKEQSWELPDKIEEHSTCKFTIQDDSAVFSFKKGQLVTVTDTLQGVMFSGKIHTITRTLQTGTSASPVLHEIDCDNLYVVFEEKESNKLYVNQYAGAIFIDQIKDRWVDGITANYAVDTDDLQADFAQGTLVNTTATNNVEDGNLELAPAGATTTITEKTTSVFGSGTLTNMLASGNTLGPSSTSALKIQSTQSVQGLSNSYTYVKIWAGSVAIISGRYLEYDLWISSSSPEAKIAVDMIFSDGTSYRDLATSNNGLWFDAQNKSPHPGTDLKGLAVDTWYHRKFLLDNFTSKTIVSVTIAIEGDSSGTYTGYIKNITETNGSGTVINTFFSGSLNVNPPQQMQKQGYQATSVNIVSTYDCSTANRVSPSYSIDPVKILKSSFVSYKTSLPTGYSFNLSYSIDGGNSYTPITTTNAALPYLLAGQSVSSKSIQFLASFTQGAGADPTQQPTFTFMQATLYPSYGASKIDVNGEWTTNGQWNAGTHTNTQAANNILSPFGAVRNWDDGNITNQTLFGGGATGPNNANSCWHYVDSKQFRMEVHQSTEGRSRMDFTGTWGDFQMEFDVSVDNANMKVGCVYRTTGWSNYDGTYAYAIEIIGTTVKLFKGSNNAGASSNFAPTQVGPTATVNLTSQAMHRVKLLIVGSSHKIYLDDVLVINTTDSTYTAAGNVGFRISNTDASNGYIGTFDNFGISITNIFSGANWTSQSFSLTGAGTYLNSVVQWDDVSTDPTQTANNLWVSYNGGSNWSICTNGASLPGLTPGQSLSGVSILLQLLFSYNASTVLPQIQDLTLYVLGGFSSTGTRVSKALSLSNVGYCGTTLVFWNAITPAGTTVTVATSLDGTSYTNVSNGGSIAGINQQPAPTIDSYNLLSSNNYINAARTGGSSATWIWDTVNSRLSVSGGTNALLLYSSLSQKDTDVYFDIDQADQAGLVWRRSDNSNFYELDIFDGSSSAGATNIMRLFKVVANVKTQIGADIAITLARGTVYRARVTMIGTSISIYFDGSLVRSVTDSSLVGPGTVGFIQVSGIARFYNLRIQPIGDDLTNKKVYTRITLTSTDPTVTPQVTDFTTLATNPNIQAGALIPTADYRNTYRSDNISDLAKKSDYLSDVRADGSAIFTARQTTPTPWVLTGNDTLISGLSVEDSADLYRNRHILIGVKDQLNVNETLPGDNTSTSWPLQYNVVSMSSMMLNGQAVTFGQKGIDSGKDFYYEVGSNSIAQDSSGDLLEKDVDSLVVSYMGDFETTVTRDNTGQFPGTISQSGYRKQSGLSIPVLTILSQASAAQTTGGTSDDLDVSLVRRIAVDINVTAKSGTGSPTLQLFIDRKSADGSYTPIWTSSSVTTAPTQVSRSIGPKCSTKESLGLTVRLRWTITGTTPSFTFSASILAHVDPFLAEIGVVTAIEDVSGQNLTVVAAQSLGDSRLQKYGLIGRTVKFGTRRIGLAAGQYLNCFVPQLGLNDAALLITSVDKTQKMLSSGNQDYWHSVEASESTNLPSWEKAMNDAAIK